MNFGFLDNMQTTKEKAEFCLDLNTILVVIIFSVDIYQLSLKNRALLYSFVLNKPEHLKVWAELVVMLNHKSTASLA